MTRTIFAIISLLLFSCSYKEHILSWSHHLAIGSPNTEKGQKFQKRPELTQFLPRQAHLKFNLIQFLQIFVQLFRCVYRPSVPGSFVILPNIVQPLTKKWLSRCKSVKYLVWTRKHANQCQVSFIEYTRNRALPKRSNYHIPISLEK